MQEELVRRRVVKTSANGKKRSYSCNHCFSQIIVCGECGELFRRIHWNNRGVKSIVWRCVSRLESTGQECHARTVNETVLENAVLSAINELLGDKPGYKEQLQRNILAAIRPDSCEQDEIDRRLAELQQELLKKAGRNENYDDVADEILRLREKKQQSAMDTTARDEQIRRINELQDFIRSQPTRLTEFDENLVKRWVKLITVYEDRIAVELKSGICVETLG